MEILSLVLVSAVVSGLVQWTKKELSASPNLTVLVLVAFSFAAALVWYFVGDNTELIEQGTKIVVTANAVYGFVIKRFEEE